MRREFVPFDEEVIKSEFDDLPAKEADKLAALVAHYELCARGNPAPAQIDDYGEGLLRLRHVKPSYQGRMIFFAVERSPSEERLVILKVYKKEGQKTPKAVIESAKARMKQWKKEGKNR